MFKVCHVSIQNEQRHLISDVSFVMGNRGFCSIYGKDDEAMEELAYVLAGFKKPTAGKLSCGAFSFTQFDEKERSVYRSSYVTSFMKDTYLLPATSVIDNITLAYCYEQEDLLRVLKQYDLYEVRNEDVESLDFKQQIATFLARLSIRNYHVLIFYPKSTPYSQAELLIIYELLKKCSKYMQVIVIQDKACNRYANRSIAVHEGQIVSDNEELEETSYPIKKVAPSLTMMQWKKILRKAKHPQGWVYMIFTMMMVLTFFFLSFTITLSNLSYVDLQLDLLNKNDTTTFEIHKVAKGKDGTLYPYERTIMSAMDLQTLKQHLSANLLKSYEPINKSFANAFLSGAYKEEEYPIYNAYPILEAKNQKQAQIKTLLGQYPNSYDEVVLPVSLAELFFGKKAQTSDYLYETFHWYGLKCVVSGVFEDADASIHEPCIYAFEGYVKHHHLAKMNSFPTSYKRMVVGNDFYQVKDIQPVNNVSRYFDGTRILYEQAIPAHQVILDINAARALGFALSTQEQQYASYQERLISYMRFASMHVGEKIQIQLYDVENSPLNSMVYKEEVTIGGFLIPNMDTLNFYNETMQAPMLFVNDQDAQEILVKNIQIHNLYYQGNSQTALRDALVYLNDEDGYEAVTKDSLLLKLLVHDPQEVMTFFILSTILFGFVSTLLYFVLIKKLIHNMKYQSANYIRFGEDVDVMKKSYQRIGMQSWRRASIWASGFAMVLVMMYLNLLKQALGSTISNYEMIIILLHIMIICLLSNGFMSIYVGSKLDHKLFAHNE